MAIASAVATRIPLRARVAAAQLVTSDRTIWRMGCEPDERLLTDRSAAPSPSDEDLRAWAADRTVFVSSVMTGMKAERRETARAIEAVGAIPMLFEEFGGMDDDPEEAYLSKVASSDIYLGILGARYGKPLKSGYSATHAEYNEAVIRGLRISIWNTEADLDGPQRDFLEAIRVFHTTGSYSAPGDLAERVTRRLGAMAAESLAPWVKVGNAVFRATNVRDDGQHITVTARIRDNTVASALEARRPSSSFGRATDTRITWPGGTSHVRVTSVAVETTASKARTVTIIAERVADNRSNLLEAGLGDRTPDDLTELAMRISLFGEQNPLGPMAFMARAENPLLDLETLGLSEDAVEQVAELFLTEELVGVRGADHITAFRLGPKRAGHRRLLLGWMPRRRYVNEAPVERHIEGEAIVGRR